MQKILDVRVLKKFGLYLAVGIGGYGGLFAVLLGGMWVSYHFFDSLAPFIGLLFAGVLLSLVYMMAREKVIAERMREQREIDLLAAKLQAQDAHDEWRENFKRRFGQYP